MSDGLPLHLARAAAYTVTLALTLGGQAERCRVAGSVRRQDPFCGDLDIVITPRTQPDLFGGTTGEWADDFLDVLHAGGCGAMPARGPQRGRRLHHLWTVSHPLRTDARRFTLRSLRNAAFKVELWTVRPESFGWMLMIRTGPRPLGPALMRCARARGFVPEVQALRTHFGSAMPTPHEHAVCKLLGVAWRPATTPQRLLMAQEMHAIADAAGVPIAAEGGGAEEEPLP